MADPIPGNNWLNSDITQDFCHQMVFCLYTRPARPRPNGLPTDDFFLSLLKGNLELYFSGAFLLSNNTLKKQNNNEQNNVYIIRLV